ncbi:MAG: hypothetical protein ACW964_20755 [Candidatus Hodarchaeales archaeon]|jgi:metal-dependent amidase/aminoacylase/carboxypeptidase family protein
MNAQELRNKIILDAKEFESYVINTRRRLHMFPETAFMEKNTAKFLEEELSEFGFNTHRISKTGVMTEISKGNDVLTVALRADIDALNISEENDVHYRKIQERCMLVDMTLTQRCYWVLQKYFLNIRIT